VIADEGHHQPARADIFGKLVLVAVHARQDRIDALPAEIADRRNRRHDRPPWSFSRPIIHARTAPRSPGAGFAGSGRNATAPANRAAAAKQPRIARLSATLGGSNRQRLTTRSPLIHGWAHRMVAIGRDIRGTGI